MTNEEKARVYNQLLHDHNILTNQINAIKGSSFELNQIQEREIKELQARQNQIMMHVNRLLAM